MSERWQAIGAPGEAYPAWVRALRGKSGTYAIRKRAGWLSSAAVWYVGESHSGNLYETLTRHFQHWRRGKSWWVGAYRPAQSDPGHTYDRSDVEVMVRVGTPTAALACQERWIARLSPRDNRAHLEAAPF